MITCDLIGYTEANSGLGNQMFIIASTIGAAIANNDKAVFPDLNRENYKFYGDTIFHKLDKNINKNFILDKYFEKPYTSTKYNKIEYKPNMCLVGHYISYKYFEHCENYIKQMFVLPIGLQLEIDNKYNNIDFSSSISMHIRRGDYLQLSNYHTNLNLNYYNNGLKYFENINNIYIFSDDIEWCKKNISFENKNVFFIDRQKEIYDLYLMSKFENFIIANSTFSWWGAYLSTAKNKKVIAPLNWFGPKRTQNNLLEIEDLIPQQWIKI